MEEARKLDLGPLLLVAALVGVIATLWATGAFAAGGSPSSSDSPGSTPPAFVQDERGQPPAKEDCPEEEGSAGSGSGDL
jgi:hypothetical protein